MSKSILLKIVLLSLGVLIFPWQSVQAGGCGPGGVGILCAQRVDPFGGRFSGNPIGVPLPATPMPGFGGSSLPGLDLMLMNAVVGRSTQFGGSGPSRQSQLLESLIPKPVTAPAPLVAAAVQKIQQNPYQPFALPPVATEAYEALHVNPNYETAANVFSLVEIANAPIVDSPYLGEVNPYQHRDERKGSSLGITMHTHPITNNPLQSQLFSGLNRGYDAKDLGQFLNSSDVIGVLKIRVGHQEMGYALVKPWGWQINETLATRMAAHELHKKSIDQSAKNILNRSHRTYLNEEEKIDARLKGEERAMAKWAQQMGVFFYKRSPGINTFSPIFIP